MKTIFYLIAIVLTSCDPPIYSHIYRNNADHHLYYYRASSSEFDFIYPDTTIRHQEVDPNYIRGIRPRTSVNIGGFGTVEEYFQEFLPKDTLSVYFFHPDTLKKYPWETIRKDYNILKRYDLSIQDMQMLDYEVVYPPTEAMKDIKMYPPYE